LTDVHDVFHVYQLKKCLCVHEEQIPKEDLNASEDRSIVPCQDFRDVRESYPKQENQDVQGAMMSSY
jgi:hypothetical protein